MLKRTLLGVLTPSSNTVVEPQTQAILSGLHEVSAHFSRFRVTEISMDEAALDQFNMQPILGASALLADAKVENIIWSGTSSGWLGFERDIRLCEEIKRETGIYASTSVLALHEIFKTTGVGTFGLITPYIDEIQGRIIKNFRLEGFDCVASENLGDRGNFSFSEVSEETIIEMAGKAAAAQPDAISIFCTNLRGAAVTDRIEREFGIPVYDSVSAGVWKGLKMAKVDTGRVKGWGRLFSELA